MIRVETLNAPARRPSILSMIAQWHGLARQRRALARLDADQLKDVGLTAEMAQKEAARPVWDAPANWRI